MLLPEVEHKSIDQATREIAMSSNRLIVIEGTFLPYVLSGMKNIIWIELTCANEIRYQRHQCRQTKVNLDSRDSEDVALCKKLYGNEHVLMGNVIQIDSGNKSVKEIVNSLVEKIDCANVNQT